ncbi:ODV-EC27 [Clanis bilineata nucleopolyhedrovirus]|uniref:ODV-EC27 n=1 Tax=Clanis bilineata nucleopolyhedrovirus TaxID=1307957 RepID=Q0N489_9ABAC|nr:ODV-EC27 [Clanis bilineata nucleopolyhedrovirus]ABF47354.1 ODV-EC27 [Clanis bilineata nucleopolyhedrovirus]
MKRCRNPKIRTVTEIINGKNKMAKDYDLTEFDAKNLNSLESYDTLKIKLVLAKYMAMLNTLKLTQPLLTIMRDRTSQQEIFAIIIASLGFVHNRVNPMVNNFDIRIHCVILENKELNFPGEPIMFRENENNEMVCIIDRISIMRMLERQFDTKLSTDTLLQEHNKLKMMKTFSSAGVKKRRNEDDNNDHETVYDIKLTETECTRYLTLLLLIEHAYCHYVIFKNHGSYNYFMSMVDHSLFTTMCKSTMNMTFSNLLMSKFKFQVEDSDHIKMRSTSGILGC